ncbi:MAG TPA: hypothetical protein ACFYEH_00165 [Candidatus Brocadiaceae bacterium]
MTDYLKVVYDEASHPLTEYSAKLCNYLFQVFGMKPGMKGSAYKGSYHES